MTTTQNGASHPNTHQKSLESHTAANAGHLSHTLEVAKSLRACLRCTSPLRNDTYAPHCSLACKKMSELGRDRKSLRVEAPIIGLEALSCRCSCGEVFVQKVHNQKYCSEKCALPVQHSQTANRKTRLKREKHLRAVTTRICITDECGTILSRYNENDFCASCSPRYSQYQPER